MIKTGFQRGIITFIGLGSGEKGLVRFDGNAFHFKKLQLRASFASPALYGPAALRCLREGIVASDDLIDAGVIFGTGFAPFRGGPIHYVRETGKQKLGDRMNQLRLEYGDRFELDTAWAGL